MQSKTSFFNRTIFLKNIAQFWPLWVGYLLVCILENPFAVFFAGSSVAINKSNLAGQMIELKTTSYIRIMQFLMSPYVIFAASAVAALCVFSYLFSGKSTNMIHALPVSRKELFLTNYISGFLFLSVPQIFASLLTVFVCVGYKITDLQYLMVALLDMLAMTVLFYSLAVFICMFSGQFLAAGAFYFILNILEIGIESILQLLMSDICFGISNVRSGTLLNMLSPVYYISKHTGIKINTLSAGVDTYSIYGQKLMMGYAITGIVLAIAAYILYKYRKLESAGDFITVKLVRPFFRWGFTICASFLAGALIGQLFEPLLSIKAIFVLVIISVLAIGVISFFVAQMFLEKRFKVFSKKRILEYGVVGIFSILILFMFETDMLGIESKIPNQADLKWVALSGSGLYIIKDKDDIQKLINIHKNIIQKKDLIESELGRHAQTYNVEFIYKTKSGTKIDRNYKLPYNKAAEADKNSIYSQLISIESQPKLYLSSLMGMNYKDSKIVGGTFDTYDKIGNTYSPKEVSIKDSDAQILYEALQQDLEEGNMTNVLKYTTLGYQDAADDIYANSISLNYYIKEGIKSPYKMLYKQNKYSANKSTSDVAYFQISKECKNTIAAMKKTGLIKNESDLYTQQLINQTSQQ